MKIDFTKPDSISMGERIVLSILNKARKSYKVGDIITVK